MPDELPAEVPPPAVPFDSPDVVAAIEAGIMAIIGERLAKLAPRWGTVVTIDHDADSCTVDLGDDGIRPAAMHVIRPRNVGDLVLIDGDETDRRVVDVKGGLAVLLADGDTGDVKWTRASSAGYGWLYADGSTVVPARFTALIALLGGNVVPNYRDRMPIGAGNTYSIGATGGATTATIAQANLPNVNFAVTLNMTDPTHRHYDGDDTQANTTAAGTIHQEPGAGTAGNKQTGYSGTGIYFTNPVANSGGSGTALSILNPYIGLKPYIHV